MDIRACGRLDGIICGFEIQFRLPRRGDREGRFEGMAIDEEWWRWRSESKLFLFHDDER